MAVWNTTFEQTPAATEVRSLGDDRIRETRVETRTRGEKEHGWANGGPDDGYHIEGSARAFYSDTNVANLNSAATPSGGGGAALTNGNSRGRISFHTVAGHYWPRVYDGTNWRSAVVHAFVTNSSTNYSGTFTTVSSFLQTSGGGVDFEVPITTPASGAWRFFVHARGTVKNDSGTGGRVAAIQLVSTVGGSDSVLDQTHLTLGGNDAGSYSLIGHISGFGASLAYTFRIRGMTTAGNFRWNETTTNPGDVEFLTPYTRLMVALRRS